MAGWAWQAAMAAATVAIVVGTITKTRWGISLPGPRRCPGCGHPFKGVFRKPASVREALWGGHTCGACGTRADKWGRPVGNGAEARNVP